jgi:predicted ArsR family transcriptional regulator
MTETELFFFNQLNEKQQRLYAGLKSSNLGYHGVSKVSKQLGLHPHTIRLGQKELESQILLPNNRIRQAGGGRKKN